MNMKKITLEIALAFSIASNAQNITTNGTILLDDAISSTRVVVDAFLNSSNRVHELIDEVAPSSGGGFTTNNTVLVNTIETVSPKTSLAPATNYVDIKTGEIVSNTYTKAETDARIAELAPQGITTNDVCNIVTNETDETFGEWTSSDENEYPGLYLVWTGNDEDDPEGFWFFDMYPFERNLGGNYYSTELTMEIDETQIVKFTRIYTSRRNALGLARLSDLATATNDLNKSLATTITNVVTRSYIESLGIEAGISADTATNIVTNVVTKAYVEGLGIEAVISGGVVTNIVTNIVTKSYVESLGIEAGISGEQVTNIFDSIVSPLLLKSWYPDGSVTVMSEITKGLKYRNINTENGTIEVCQFSSSGFPDADNSDLTGRVVIPPYVDINGGRFTVVGVADYEMSLYGNNGNTTSVLAPTTIKTIGELAFYGCTNLVSVSFPSVTTVKDNAFASCSSIMSISLPFATTIGMYSFSDCTLLTSISLTSATTVGINAFYGCTSLTSVSLPSVTVLAPQSFYNCGVLSTVDFGNSISSVPQLGNNAFYGVSTNCVIIVPDNLYTNWISADGWSNLVNQGFRFIKHSEFEDVKKYEVSQVISNTVTKAYIESLGIESGIDAQTATNISEVVAQTSLGSFAATGTVMYAEEASTAIGADSADDAYNLRYAEDQRTASQIFAVLDESASTNYADTAASNAVANADTTYRRTIGITNLNQSIQYVNITDTAPTTLAISMPTDGATKDWMVYVYAATNVTLTLPSSITYWMADVAYTNDVPPATPTALWFSQVTDGIFILGRQELTEVTAP